MHVSTERQLAYGSYKELVIDHPWKDEICRDHGKSSSIYTMEEIISPYTGGGKYCVDHRRTSSVCV